jgi:hypothetical protein
MATLTQQHLNFPARPIYQERRLQKVSDDVGWRMHKPGSPSSGKQEKKSRNLFLKDIPIYACL